MTIQTMLPLLSLVGIKPETAGTQIRFSCPFASISGHKNGHDAHPSFGIRPFPDGKVLWNCRACGRSGGSLEYFFLLLEAETKIPTRKIREQLKTYNYGVTIEDISQLSTFEPLALPPAAPLPSFPEALLDPYKGSVPKYVLDRGVALATCKQWELGYDKFQRRVVFPVRSYSGMLAGAVGRLIQLGGNMPRYSNYWHFERRHWLYGEHLFKRGQVAVIVEGPMDVLKSWQTLCGTQFAPLATFGAQASAEQVSKIVRLTDRVIALYDPNAAGREGSERLRRMLGRRVHFYKAAYPSGCTQDPGEMDSETLMSAVQNAEFAF